MRCLVLRDLGCSTSCEMTLKDAAAGSGLPSQLFYLRAWRTWLSGSPAYFSFFTQSCLSLGLLSLTLRGFYLLQTSTYTRSRCFHWWQWQWLLLFFLAGSQLLHSQGWPWTPDLLPLSSDIQVRLHLGYAVLRIELACEVSAVPTELHTQTPYWHF